jgi:hypothetical protein
MGAFAVAAPISIMSFSFLKKEIGYFSDTLKNSNLLWLFPIVADLKVAFFR